MTARELFEVGVRWIGLVAALVSLPAVLQLDYVGAVPGVAGLILITRAGLIAQLCYPRDLREEVLKDLRDR